MRVAVLITGQPRLLEEGAWWWKNKVFPSSFQNLQVDYFCYFWNDGSDNLKERIQNSFNPVRYQIENYDAKISPFINQIQEYNKQNSQYLDLIPNNIKENLLFTEEFISDYGKNFYGQFLAADGITKMVGNLSHQYDIVIKSRSDAIINPMEEKNWLAAFHNMHRNPIFHDKMFASWMYVDSGMPHVGDFAFFSLPSTWYNFSRNLKENLLKITTEQKAIFYELKIANYHFTSHWLWMKSSYHSKTHWLSFSVVWPTAFDSTVIRNKHDMNSMTFKMLKEDYENFNKIQNA
jgi:hypothetical protein